MAAHGAFRDACAGDFGDATHGAGEPAVVELQGTAQVGARAAVGVVPSGGQVDSSQTAWMWPGQQSRSS